MTPPTRTDGVLFATSLQDSQQVADVTVIGTLCVEADDSSRRKHVHRGYNKHYYCCNITYALLRRRFQHRRHFICPTTNKTQPGRLRREFVPTKLIVTLLLVITRRYRPAVRSSVIRTNKFINNDCPLLFSRIEHGTAQLSRVHRPETTSSHGDPRPTVLQRARNRTV